MAKGIVHKIGLKEEIEEIHHPVKKDEHGNVVEEAHTEIKKKKVHTKETKHIEVEQPKTTEHVPTLEERVTELERIVAELTKPKPKPK